MRNGDKNTFAVNLQPLCVPELTGIGIYTKEISERLLVGDNQFDSEAHFFSLFNKKKTHSKITKTFSMKNENLRTCSFLPYGLYLRAPWLSTLIPYERALSSKADLTVFFNFLRPHRMKGKSIVTVHDMVCMRFPETMDDRNRRLLERFLPESCQKADVIMAVSAFSKKKIAACLSIPLDKIHIAPCGINTKQFFPPVSEDECMQIRKKNVKKYNLQKPYILYLGTLEPRKNVKVLIHAFTILEKKYPELQLVLCGGSGWKCEETLAEIEKTGLKDKIKRTGYIPESEKRALYIGAKCFVFPSLYEGFGMPPLEAMACGTPVVCSNASSLPEVVGEGGFLCDPEVPDDFSEKIDRILSADYPVLEMKNAADLQVKKYTWEKTAEVYRAVIENLIRN